MKSSANAIKAGVVGAGNLGQHHARVYSQMKGVKLVGVADPNAGKGREVARACGCDYFAKPEELVGLVQAVSIVVPTSLHHDVAGLFLEKGVHCLLEKPMTTTLAEADSLLSLAKKKGAILQVGHIERFNPAILAIQSMKANPRFIEAHRLGPYSPRNTDVGVVLELMIHDLDMVLDMVGQEVVKVEALGVPVLSRTADIANVRLKFKGGCVANLTASRVTTDKQRKIRLFTKEAYLSVDYLKKEVKVYRLKEGADPSRAGSMLGLAKMIHMETLPIQDEEQLKLELGSFMECVRDNKAPVVSGEQGRQALALALEIERQIAEMQKEI